MGGGWCVRAHQHSRACQHPSPGTLSVTEPPLFTKLCRLSCPPAPPCLSAPLSRLVPVHPSRLPSYMNPSIPNFVLIHTPDNPVHADLPRLTQRLLTLLQRLSSFFPWRHRSAPLSDWFHTPCPLPQPGSPRFHAASPGCFSRTDTLSCATRRAHEDDTLLPSATHWVLALLQLEHSFTFNVIWFLI